MASPSREAALVFADALLERGEPWGEFIVRSLRGQHAAANELRQRHERQWLGPLHGFLTGLEYRDGLLFSAALARRAPRSPSRLAHALAHPLLASLRRLTREKSPVKRTNSTSWSTYRAFALADSVTALEEIEGSHLPLLRELVERKGRGIVSLLEVPLERAHLRLLERRELERVRSLELTVRADAFAAALEVLRKSPSVDRRRVRMTFTSSESGANDLLAIDAWSSLSVASLRVWDLTLTRSSDGTTATWAPRGADYRLERRLDPFHAARLATAVKDLRRVEFDGPAPLEVAVAFARRSLPRVSFGMADGSELKTRKHARVETPQTVSEHVVSFLERIWGVS